MQADRVNVCNDLDGRMCRAGCMHNEDNESMILNEQFKAILQSRSSESRQQIQSNHRSHIMHMHQVKHSWLFHMYSYVASATQITVTFESRLVLFLTPRVSELVHSRLGMYGVHPTSQARSNQTGGMTRVLEGTL